MSDSVDGKHRYEKAGWFSKLIFWWIVPLLQLGRRRKLNPEDVYQLPFKHTAEELGQILSKHWEIEVKLPRPKLGRSLYRSFNVTYFKMALILGFREIICRVGQGICLTFILCYFDKKCQNEVGIAAAAVLVLLTILASFTTHQVYFRSAQLGMQIRVALTTLIYEKSLRLSLDQANVGQVTNLISNDVNRFDRWMFVMSHLFVTPIQFILIFGLLWSRMGSAVGGGLLVSILTVIVQLLVGRVFQILRRKIALETDARVEHTTELIHGIRWIKMATWEDAFAVMVENTRQKELTRIGQMYAVAFSIWCFTDVAIKFGQFLIIFLYELSGRSVAASQVFLLSIMLIYLGNAVSSYFFFAISGLFEWFATLQRIQTFLLLNEKEADAQPGQQEAQSKMPILELSAVTALCPPRPDPIISDVTFNLGDGEIIGIAGSAGCGKTSLLRSILGELKVIAGEVKLHTRKVAYVSQEPWIFPATLLDNIIFGKPLNTTWFQNVIHACALTPDIQRMPFGVNTFLGDRGLTLSGGQKARINFARAVYADADLYLLDDPLSGVDINVAKHIMSECIRGLLASKAIVFVTHQMRHLEGAKSVLVLKNGQIESRGSVEDVGGQIEHEVDVVDDLESESEPGSSKELMRDHQLGDKNGYGTFVPPKTDLEMEEYESVGTVTMGLYWKYWTAAGMPLFLSLVTLFIITQGLLSASDYWLKLWTRGKIHQRNGVMIYLYLVIGYGFVQLIRNLVLAETATGASREIHRKLLLSVLHAPMRFFEINTAGRILNRLVNDMGVTDDPIPTYYVTCITPLFQLIGAIIIIAAVIPVTIIPAIVMLGIFVKCRNFYLQTSASLKRIESIGRSPVFGIASSTLAGLVTIRASNAEEAIKKEFRKLQNRHSASYFTYLGAPRWFAFCVDFTTALYVTIVVICCVCTPDLDSASAGLAISTALATTVYCSQFANYLTDLENGMVAVERILEYTNTPSEGIGIGITGGIGPPLNWPKNGRIQLDECSVRYGSNPPVLHSVSLNVQPSEKIGIVGRTGAGKSSLISALFRLVELNFGSIHIDFVDVFKISLRDLRSKISIIPQNPVLFVGSLRQNLDPFGHCTDSEIMEALTEIDFAYRFTGEHHNGLDTQISGGGENLSHGERQLLCLARALLEKTKILVLDEATAHVDEKTDFRVQNTLRSKFRNRTVITIAHRLSTVMESDKILVLGDGKVLEFDHPYHLLQNPDGHLRNLCQRAGPRLFANFLQVAANSFQRRQ